ncbi:hypothetical protein D3C72_2088180 [compost metagenome]
MTAQSLADQAARPSRAIMSLTACSNLAGIMPAPMLEASTTTGVTGGDFSSSC